MLLQLGVPGGVELVILALVLIIDYLIARWVYRDATARGNDNAMLWGVGTFIGFVLGFVPGLLVLVLYYVVGR